MLKEIESYLSFLQDLRNQMKDLLKGLPADALDWKPIVATGDLATNSVGSMTLHLAGSENFWMREIIGGQPIQRNRDAEFAAKGDTAADLISKLEMAARGAEEILASINAGKLEENRKFRDRTVTVRWAILHVIEHYAVHLGHMQLTRQLWLHQRGK